MISCYTENRDEKGRVVVDEVENRLDQNLQEKHVEKLQADQAQLQDRLKKFNSAFWTQHQRVLAAFEQDRQAAQNPRKG